MENKSFIHKIIWIPNYTSRPKGLTSMVGNVLQCLPCYCHI